MDNNFKLRKAIIAAIMVAGSGYSLKSHAIGLGDIKVHSYLGQPLVADVPLYGVRQQDNASCFHVKGDGSNTIRNASFRLNRTSGGNATLKIQSPSPITEPIAVLTVVNTCDTLFTRQYNLLVDPAPANAISTNNPTTNNAVEAPNVTVVKSQASTSIPTTIAKTTTKPKKVKVKRTKTKARKAKKTTRAQSVSNNQVSKREKTATVKTNKPLLTISGGNLTASNAQAMQLNFDKSIDPNRKPVNTALLDDNLTDELTVMQNRITHLDTQLSKLSLQHTELKAANAQQKTMIAEAQAQNDFLRTLAMFLGGALLVSSYFFVDWLRRRNERIRAEQEDALWHAMQAEQAEKEEKLSFDLDKDFAPSFEDTLIEFIDEETMDDEQPLKEVATASQEATQNEETAKKAIAKDNIYPLHQNPNAIVQEDTEVLEDAELFVSHGRSALAIQVLNNHLKEQPKDSASAWMYLLDLLVKEDLQEEYEAAAIECNKHFNIRIVPFNESKVSAVADNTLESFERITNELQKLWGTPEAVKFLDELIYNTRMEPRMGFSKEVFEEINLLREIAKDEIRLLETSAPATELETAPQLPSKNISEEFQSFSESIKEANQTKKVAEVKEPVKKETTKDEAPFEFELLDTGSD